MRKFVLSVICCCFITSSSFAQNKIIDSLLNELKVSKEDSNKVDLFYQIGTTFFKVKEYKQALQYANGSLLLAEKLHLSKRVARAYIFLGNTNRGMGNNSEALQNYTASLKVNEEIGDKLGVANSYHNIGIIYSGQDDYPTALKNYLAALKIREEIDDKSGIAATYHNMGNIHRYQGNFTEALKNYYLSLKIKEKIGKKPDLITTYYVIGFTYGQQGNYHEALKSHLAALKICEEIGDKGEIADTYGIIGNMYNNQGNYPEALKNYFIAIKLYTETEQRRGLAITYNNIGTIYSSMAKAESNPVIQKELLNSALKYYLDNLKIVDELGHKGDIAMSYNNIGSVYNKFGNYDEALKNLFYGLEIRKKVGDKRLIIESYRNIGGVYKGIKKFPESEQFYNYGLSLAKEIGAKDLIRNIYTELSELDTTRGNWQGAYRNHKLFILYRDSLINEENIKKTLRMQMQYEFDKKEDSLKYNQTLTNEQLKHQTLLVVQHRQSFLLKEKELMLSDKEKELHHLAFLRTQADLQAEQSERQKKEKELTIANQEKSLQSSRLNLQKTQLDLKESQIQSEKKQRLFYIGGGVLMLLLFVFIYRNIRNRQRADRMIAAERLKSEKAGASHKMAELELQSLRAQLNPHFMFNSLNAIQELILKEDNDNSHLYLSRFSELLRMLLDNAHQPFVSLKKEINLLEIYLSLENLRISDLKYSIEVDPAIDVNRVTIPNMMLQPYIENAIWHGLSHKPGEKKLNIRISKKENMIVCEVEDNGVGREKAAELKSLYRKEHRSKGMELLSKRFALLSKEYGSEIETSVTDLHDNGTALGTLVHINVPYSLAEQPKPVYS